MGRVLMTIVADTSGRHDCAVRRVEPRAPTRARYGDGGVPRRRPRTRATCSRVGRGQARTRAAATSPPDVNLFKWRARRPTTASLHARRRAAPGHVRRAARRARRDRRSSPTPPIPSTTAPDYTGSPLRCHRLAPAPRPDRRPVPDGHAPSGERAFQNTDELPARAWRTGERAVAVASTRWSPARAAVGRRSCPPAHTLRIVDLGGNQAVDCLLYDADDTAERYSARRHHRRPAQHLPRRRHARCCSNEGRR